MRSRFSLLISLLAFLTVAVSAQEAGDLETAVEEAAREFGLALTTKDPSRLKPLMPRRGKVQLRLQRLGPEQGSYSAGQVLALFEDFLQIGTVRTFELAQPCDANLRSYTLVRARAELIDREGRDVMVELHLTIVPEDDRWILREIRETPQ